MWAVLAAAFHLHAAPVVTEPVATVLCYHTFDSPKITPYTVSQDVLREQMRYLKVQRIPVIGLPQLENYLHGKGSIPAHAVVITIDDGYKTARTKAWPVLHEFNFPFTVFIYPEAISRHGSALTWDDLLYLRRHGVDIESHSYSHPILTHPSIAMDKRTYRAWLDKELAGSKAILEQHLGAAVTAIAYPYGAYDETVVERTKLAGYQSAYTCDDGNVIRTTDPWHVNRRLVFRGTRLKDFVLGFGTKPIGLGLLSPRDGERINEPPQEIIVNVSNWRSILPETATIVVDKVGRRPISGKFDQKTGRLAFPIPPNSRHGFFFVSLTARDRQLPSQWREASWLFIVRKNASRN